MHAYIAYVHTYIHEKKKKKVFQALERVIETVLEKREETQAYSRSDAHLY